ncbi:MAG: BrnT family toxin [Chloroflexi bacterium]|nr:BrnT family toxin [Chloroflexota bacterium]
MSHPFYDFEWNAAKAAANLKKHGVSFEEGATAFEDDHAYIQADELHSDEEARQTLLGYSERNRLLAVSFAPRAPNLIRIISVRKATPRERECYEETSDV